MHELSLAQSMIDQVIGLVEQHGAKQVIRITVEVGAFSGIVIDSFKFGFEALSKEDERLLNVDLEILSPPPCYQCLECGRKFETEGISRAVRCPYCDAVFLQPIGGDDIILKTIEME